MIGQIKSLIQHAEEYVETNAALVKFKAIRTTAATISYIVSILVIIVIALLFVFLLFIGLSITIGHALGKLEYGFFIMSFVIGIFCIVLYLKRESLLKNRLCDLLIDKILE
jgi:hypothetical protein